MHLVVSDAVLLLFLSCKLPRHFLGGDKPHMEIKGNKAVKPLSNGINCGHMETHSCALSCHHNS
jgi:hypothetical protein